MKAARERRGGCESRLFESGCPPSEAPAACTSQAVAPVQALDVTVHQNDTWDVGKIFSFAFWGPRQPAAMEAAQSALAAAQPYIDTAMSTADAILPDTVCGASGAQRAALAQLVCACLTPLFFPGVLAMQPC